ncbi:hypothetical protein NRIC_37610 [Enterococcus florum]|uniref:Viral A-type inclusion protein n=1 Tax=Enterococcus florum TaxID=2480627 RepID=A0A4P5PCL0_9ENTE|nr:hypothetical protein [Enterococcus florum]GCF95870.1 hypothetical protein NRIC_37610 [Enterococcus florum]
MGTPEKQAPETSFDSVKESASNVLGDLMSQLQRLEQAMEQEDMGAVYQIYWKELPASIQQSSNANHEIDNYLTSKLDRELLKRFPFMRLNDQLSPILLNYQLGSYYRDRAVLQIDATQPSLTILPEILAQWKKVEAGDYKKEIASFLTKEDELDAKAIAARSEIQKIDEQIREQSRAKRELEETKGLLNRKKIEEEIEELDKKINAFKAEREKWTPYVGNDISRDSEKINLDRQKKSLELEQAIALKELRIIKKRFGSLAEMEKQLKQFIQDFLKKGDK